MCTCTCYLQMDSMKQKKGQEFDIFWLGKKRAILVRSDGQPNMLQTRWKDCWKFVIDDEAQWIGFKIVLRSKKMNLAQYPLAK